ncbi:MAG: radical SAM protein [Candidatus Atribacteria bacterium]|nr:radical SAM protein [Candidatus Atribacteria bacterium]
MNQLSGSSGTSYCWSKYNLIFQSEKYGHLLYNALSNSFAEIDEVTLQELKSIREDPEHYDFRKNPGLFIQLWQTKVIVCDREEEDLLNIMALRQLFSQFDTSVLGLTIIPTTGCNFTCPYCYERFKRPMVMGEEVEEAIIDFIQRFGKIRYLNINWFGGEPLLAFDRIGHLTEKIQALNIPFQASMPTNGYLLGKEVVDRLDELKINKIQVTIDGNEDTHNTRRKHVENGDSYQVIMSNLRYLVDHWDGHLNLRVNIDSSNRNQFVETYHDLSQKFGQKKINVYPGIVNDSPSTNPDINCQFNREEEIGFYLELYQKHGIQVSSFYPDPNHFGCMATRRNGYIIGPEGELYNCFHDLGDADMVVGHLLGNQSWNLTLLSRYMVGVSPSTDPECVQCFYRPVCDGGCAQQRLRKKYGHENFDPCVRFKDRLPEVLECYYDLKNKKRDSTQERQ